MTDIKRVGLIGTGIMGAPMAENLLKAGYTIAVHSRTKSRADHLITAGATWHDSPADLAANTACIISIVPDSPDVERIYLADDGIIQTVKPDTICIDMSTISPDVAKTVAEKLADKNAHFLDAPVSGGKTGAEAGTLAIMVGGDAQTLERATPVLNAVGKKIVHCGPVGNGQLTKLCNQLICGLNLLAVSEAMVFAEKVGLDPNVMLDAVSSGAAGSWAVDNLGRRMANRDFDPMFMIDLQQKDLKIALDTAYEQHIPLPGTALVQQLMAANQAAGEGKQGTQALIQILERLANSAP